LLESFADNRTERGVYTVDKKGNPVALISEKTYRATSRFYYVTAEQHHQPVWTTVEILNFTPEYGFNYVFPVYRNGTLIAVVTSNLIVRVLSNFLSEQQYGVTGSCMIVERSGDIVASSVPAADDENKNGTLHRIQAIDSEVPQFSDAAKEIVKRYGGFNDTIGNFSFSSHGETMFVTVTTVFDPRGIDWVTVIIIPRNDWYSSIDKGHWISLSLCILLLVLAIIFAIWTAYLIVHPLQRMAKVMTVITTKMELVFERNDIMHSSLKEIAMLQESFARLLHTLSSFMKYVPVEVVRLLVQHNAEPVIGMEPRNVTLFFSDITDFTTIAEHMEPCNLARVLSEYLGNVSDVILQSGGTLADYIGDGVFAFWNAPNDVINHPSAVCEAALTQQECIRKLNYEWAKHGLPSFKVRMGIHTGFSLCGNSGSGKRMKYTAIGDSVNLASRLENLNKRYDTHILITGAVHSQVQGEFLCRYFIHMICTDAKTIGCCNGERKEHTYLDI
jgi:adenylate cyclase